jgi:pheromone shutdown protein TraB
MDETPAPGQITLVGTGHVFDIGARVRQEIRQRAPHVVAIELDPPRYHALRNKSQDRKGAPIVYRMLADFQTKVANEYGVEAGDEMLAAANEAQALGVPLALIDADAQRTFQRLVKEMRFGEKMRLAGSAFLGVIIPSKNVEKQVAQMQEDYASYFAEMGKKFPTLKRVLLDERNEHMARALVEIAKTGQRVVAVVGDGHVDGMLAILRGQGQQVEVVRLKDLRAKQEAPPIGTNVASVTFDISSAPPPPRGPPG